MYSNMMGVSVNVPVHVWVCKAQLEGLSLHYILFE